MFVLETQISSNNPSYPMSVYRASHSTSVEVLIHDIERMLKAYYSLIDDCEEHPEWQNKVRMDLGGTVSYLALTIDESSRNGLLETSDVFLRFDAEKQVYFK